MKYLRQTRKDGEILENITQENDNHEDSCHSIATNIMDIDQKREDKKGKDINQKKGKNVCHDRLDEDDRLKNDGQKKDIGKGWNFWAFKGIILQILDA